jgi:site-specific DNA recombinase
MTKVILYIRVSTDEQADKGYSQRGQNEMLVRYADLKGYTVIEKYFEDHSAKSFERPEFKKLLLTLRKHKNIATLLLFTKWDRFSRNAADAYHMIALLNKLGVEPQAVEQPLDLMVPENKIMLAFYLAAPEVENDRRSMNVFAGMRRAKKEGRRMGRAMIGYSNKITEDGKKYIVPNEKAAIVKWIFEILSTGNYTAQAVWQLAKAKGLKCEKNTFWNLLRNEGYCGLIKIPAFKNELEELVPGQHEPIISKALFYEVQDLLNNKSKKQRPKSLIDDRFPLRGYLICPSCSKLLTASASRGKMGNYYSYYHCTSACGTRFKANDVNDTLLQELSKWKPNEAIKQLYKLILKDVYEQQSNSRSSNLATIKKEIDQLKTRQTKALNLLLDDSMGGDDYLSIKNQCEQNIYKLENQLANLSKTLSIEPLLEKAITVLSEIDKMYIKASTESKRKIISSMFPEKLLFDGSNFRTQRMNEAVSVIYNVGKAFSEIKMRQISSISEMSQNVNWLGLEPRAHTLKVYCSTN